MITKQSRIFVAGHNGMVGSAILRKLNEYKFNKIVTIERKELDLTDQKKTFFFLKKTKPDFVFICAAKVGGIYANNKYKGDFIFKNLQIQNNLIHGSYLSGVRKLIFLGSSCVYPKHCKQPIKEKYLLNGYLEPTNEPYAIAKIAGIKLCQSYNYQYKTSYKCLMPANLFGPGDNYDRLNSHFLASIIRKSFFLKINKKKLLKLWGTGQVKRELLYVDDLAEACIYFMKKSTKEEIINIGVGVDSTIKDYAYKILKILNIKAEIIFDKNIKINGTPRKLLDVSLAKKLGWYPRTKFEDAIKITYDSFAKNFK